MQPVASFPNNHSKLAVKLVSSYNYIIILPCNAEDWITLIPYRLGLTTVESVSFMWWGKRYFVVGFLLGDSLACKFYVLTFRNTLFQLHRSCRLSYPFCYTLEHLHSWPLSLKWTFTTSVTIFHTFLFPDVSVQFFFLFFVICVHTYSHDLDRF
jgi:hypothetical protein